MVVGLQLGADDFIRKPFGKHELLARLRAVLRRAQARSQPARRFAMRDLTVYPLELRAERDGTSSDLSPRDAAILALLHERSGEVVDRDTLLNRCWGLDYFPESRTLDMHIAKLRKRIEATREPALMKPSVALATATGRRRRSSRARARRSIPRRQRAAVAQVRPRGFVDAGRRGRAASGDGGDAEVAEVAHFAGLERPSLFASNQARMPRSSSPAERAVVAVVERGERVVTSAAENLEGVAAEELARGSDGAARIGIQTRKPVAGRIHGQRSHGPYPRRSKSTRSAGASSGSMWADGCIAKTIGVIAPIRMRFSFFNPLFTSASVAVSAGGSLRRSRSTSRTYASPAS